MRTPGGKLIVQSARWARSRIGHGIVVLGYHRLGDPADDPFDLCIAPSDFTEHLAAIARHAQLLTLQEAVRALLSRRMPSRAVVLTFDDGYADTLLTVLPLLERTGSPATVFVTTGWRGRQFWWDELADILLKPPLLPARLELVIRGAQRAWSFAPAHEGTPSVDASGRTRALHSIAGELRGLTAAERDEQLCRLREWSGQQFTIDGQHRSLTAPEIQRLSKSPLIEIGAHTVSHPDLTVLSQAELDGEIAQSRIELAEITGNPVTSFSYPHGRYSDATISGVRRAGLTIACSSRADVVRTGSDPLALPRMWIQPRDGRAFERWLQRWLVN